MEIKTKFNINDKVFTIDTKTLKMKEIEIGSVCVFADEDGNRVKYIAKGESLMSDSYKEDVCFGTDQELLNHIRNK